MRTMLAAALAAALLACSDQSTTPLGPTTGSPEFASTTNHLTVTEPFDIVGFEECVEGPLHVAGVVRTTTNEVAESETGTVHHLLLSVTAHGTAVGEVTGAAYRFHEVLHSGSNQPAPEAPHGVVADRLLVHLVSRGPQPDAMIRLAFLEVFTGNGMDKVLLDTEHNSCSAG